MLESVVGAFVDGLRDERALDLPFMAMLRTHGFFDVQFLHGHLEFGKDYIAKRIEDCTLVQYLFQGKHGNVSQTTWTQELHPQLEEMEYANLGHPNFDRTARRVRVAVATGRLRGNAQILFEQYREREKERQNSEVRFWGRETLIEMLTAENCLGARRAWVAMGGAIERMQSGEWNFDRVELFTREWMLAADLRDLSIRALECSVLRQELDTRGLGLHSAFALHGLVRAACEALHRGRITQTEAEAILDLAGTELKRHVAAMAPLCDGTDEASTVNTLTGRGELPLFVVGPRALVLGELVALILYLDVCRGNVAPAEDVARLVRIASIPACHRPLGDRYAVSTLTIAAALAACGQSPADLLRGTMAWVLQAYEDDGLGLATIHASAEEELRRTAAAALDSPGIQRRMESYLAAAVLDACSVIEERQLYEDCVHDADVEDVCAYRLVPVQGPDEYAPDGSGCHASGANDFSTTWVGTDGWRNAGLHGRVNERWFDGTPYGWVGFALSCLYRDRWWLASYRKMVTHMRGDSVGPLSPSAQG